MIIGDYHNHTDFSADCDTPAELMIEKAIDLGLSYLCMTDHMDPDMQFPGLDFTFDLDEYFAKHQELKKRYQDKITLLTGIELGLQPHIGDDLRNIVNAGTYDFIIGSSHMVNGVDPYYPAYYTDKNEYQAYEQYFLSILDNVKAYDCYHVYGHLDYIMRYVPNQTKPYDPMAYGDIFREILKTIIDHGKGIEVNTGSLYKGFDFPHPHAAILKLYKDLGGELITIGSDAHKPQHYGYGFDRAEAVLRQCGFDSYTVFVGGKPQQLKF
jgi:histidinol-phosphatase (PHP family)